MPPDGAFAQLRAALNQSLLYEAVASAADLKRIELDCLLLLHLDGPTAAGDLSATLGLSSGGMSGILDRLEREGLAQRGADPGDRRRVIVRISIDGETRLNQAIEPVLQALSQYPAGTDFGAIAGAFEQARAELRSPAHTPDDDREIEGLYAAPLADLQRASLQVNRRFEALRLSSVEGSDLFRGTLSSGAKVEVEEGDVRLIGKRSPVGRGPAGTMQLNSAIPWQIAIRGGVSQLSFETTGLDIQLLEFTGGINDARITGDLAETLNIRISGGANRIELPLPTGAAARATLRGGMLRVESDGTSVRLFPRRVWLTPGADGPLVYDFLVRGGMSTITFVR